MEGMERIFLSTLTKNGAWCVVCVCACVCVCVCLFLSKEPSEAKFFLVQSTLDVSMQFCGLVSSVNISIHSSRFHLLAVASARPVWIGPCCLCFPVQ